MNKVVVTGIGITAPICPFESSVMFWRSLCSGQDAIRRMSPPILKNDSKWLMARIEMPEELSPHEKIISIAENAFGMAISDSGLTDYSRAGLCLGTVLGNILAKEVRLLSEATELKEDLVTQEKLPYLAQHLSRKYGIGLPAVTVSTACASGTDAIGMASRYIVQGKADIMIAGGADVLSDFALFGFNALQALTHDKLRPFDRNRSGLALGEGAAFLVLESEAHAVRRNARIYGNILGYASRVDAHHLTAPHREGRGLAEAVVCALNSAGIPANEIDYINAHGTGTPYNDLMETQVIKKIFGNKAYSVPVSSTKSMLGHSFGAAGAIEAICCLFAINYNVIPPTINYETPDPECDLDYVPNNSRKHDIRVALSLSAGFGGQNAVLLMGRKCAL